MNKTIQLLSDIHVEFHHDDGKSFIESLDPSGVDVLVIAGDLCPLEKVRESKNIIAEFCRLYPSVVYVAGNHEYYGSDPDTCKKRLDKLESLNPNLFVLDNEERRPQGIKFYGGTMWYPYDASSDKNRHFMRDYTAIKNLEPFCHDQNKKFQTGFYQASNEKSIIVSHHLPSMESVPLRFKRSAINSFFVGDMVQDILDNPAQFWFHGHTHSSCDYMIGKTRVLANPLGYPGEPSQVHFNNKLTVTVEIK